MFPVRPADPGDTVTVFADGPERLLYPLPHRIKAPSELLIQ